MKQKLRKLVKKKNRQIYNCNLGCSILLAVNNKTTRQKRIKDIEELSINTIDIYILSLYICIQKLMKNLKKIGHILGHKANLN